MKQKTIFLLCLTLAVTTCFGQLFVARDTISVIENNYVLKMPWGNGLNYANISSADLDFDGKKDIIAYDRLNQFGTGPFRCYTNTGNPGQIKYKARPEYSYCFPKVSNWAIVLDYNCDGKADLFCSTSAGIKVYKNVSSAPTPSSAATLSFALVSALLSTTYTPGDPTTVANLYASSVGVPGIADIDGDGDLDILTFSPLGVFAEFHKNLSKELYGNCDSLIFERTDECWGKFSESSCSSNFNQCGLKPAHVVGGPGDYEKTYHAGACLTCLDSDADGDQDLILGDISCNTVEYLHNGGSVSTPLITDSTHLYPNFPAKNNTTQIRINNFPCTYYIDADNDNVNDLVATPNAFGSENATSVWLYKNTSATGTVNFQYVKNNFLQDEMIEVGQNSFPVIFDYNADGKKDLLIGNYGYYLNNSLKSRLTLYENTGSSPAQPVYSLVTRDYAGLSAQNLNNAVPAIGDIDNDGDVDICIGTSSGQIHWLKNTAGIGNPAVFTFFNNPFTFTTTSAAAAPQLFDLDSDGKLDLLIGMKNGRIAFYRNNSVTAANPSFTLVTSFLGGVDVKGDVNLYGIDGYAAPYFYNEGGTTKLLVGSINGNIFHYTVSSINSAFNLVTTTTNNYNEGGQSSPYFEDINNDNLRDLLIGNAGGGLCLFSSKAPYVGIDETGASSLDALVSLFPNPTAGSVSLRLDKISFDAADMRVYDLVGKEVLHTDIRSNNETIDLQPLQPGIYFASISITSHQETHRLTKKIIRE